MDYKLQISRKNFEVLKKSDNSKKEEIVNLIICENLQDADL